MSDWELHDLAVQMVGEWLVQQGVGITGQQGNPGIDPSIWFERGRGPEYVVVRAARHPVAVARPPENLAEVQARCAEASNLGFFVSVSIMAVGAGGAPKAGPLHRGAPMFSDFDERPEPMVPVSDIVFRKA